MEQGDEDRIHRIVRAAESITGSPGRTVDAVYADLLVGELGCVLGDNSH